MTQNTKITIDLRLNQECPFSLGTVSEYFVVNNIDPVFVKKLTLIGRITDDDLRYIRDEMDKTLQELDLSDASFEENKIPQFAFEDCRRFSSIIIPNSTKSIERLAFKDCINLDSITIPELVAEIDEEAFCNCYYLTSISVNPNNPDFASEDGVLFNKNKTKMILYPQRRQGDYIVPDSVVKIENNTFSHCNYLTSVVIPKSVTEIGDYAFSSCHDLESVSIPDSVTWIDNHAFENCFNLNIMVPKSVIYIGNNAFDGCLSITIHPDNLVYETVKGKIRRKQKKSKNKPQVENYPKLF